MSDVRKYQVILSLVLFGFLYLLTSEVTDRWSKTISLYSELSEKQDAMLKPEELTSRKSELVSKRKALTASLAIGKEAYEQNQIGLVKFLNSHSAQSNMFIQSLTPSEPKSTGQVKAIAFKIDALGGYHKVGYFVNAIEEGVFDVRLTKLTLVPQKPGSSILLVQLEGQASVVSTN